MKLSQVWTLSLFVCGFSVMCPSIHSYAATELARVNNQVITLEEFNRQYNAIAQSTPGSPPSKKEFLDQLINRHLGIDEAKRHKLDRDPIVADQIDTVLYTALLEKSLTKEVEAIHTTEDEAKSYYKKNPTLRTSHILVGLRPNASADEVKKARETIQKIYDDHIARGTQSFAEVAQQFSQAPTANMGGDSGYQTRGQGDPIYYEESLKLGSPGKVSKIFRGYAGFYIVKLTAVLPWEEVSSTDVKRQVFEQKRAKLFEMYMASLKKKAKVSIHSNLLNN